MQLIAKPISTGLLTAIIALSVGSPGVAGPLEDGMAAHDRGDVENALRLIQPLADQGDAEAQYYLGFIYRTGLGIAEDNTEAVKWYRKAADQGHVSAQYYLAIMYNLGEGIPENDVEAVLWYRKAAAQGHASAQNSLGIMYAKGEGVIQNDVEAYKWWNLAAAQGVGSAKKSKAIVAKNMTREQVAEAQRLSAEWKPVSER